MPHASMAGAAVDFANGMTGAVSTMGRVMGGASLVAAPLFLGNLFFRTFVHGPSAQPKPGERVSPYKNFNPSMGF